MSVYRAQREISSTEFAEWKAYHRIEPFGEERADLRMGILASHLSNLMRKGKGRRLRPRDFMPNFTKRIRSQSVADMVSQIKGHLGAMGVTLGNNRNARR